MATIVGPMKEPLAEERDHLVAQPVVDFHRVAKAFGHQPALIGVHLDGLQCRDVLNTVVNLLR